MTALHLAGQTFHGRKGRIANAFRYGVDYVLLEPEDDAGPSLFSRNRANLAAIHDSDHGGAPGQGRGAAWVREVLARHNLPAPKRLRLLAQPRLLGHVFNPVSFWLAEDDSGLRVMIAEVTNTYGDRHSYLCHRPDLGPITAEDRLTAQKIFHVSPFQTVAGSYTFRIDLRPDRLNIVIDYAAGEDGLIATLTGPLVPLTNLGLVKALIRRPFGSRRVLALIHWQALKLWAKGSVFRPRPQPPTSEVS
ncbi:DUF1365 family protein [bacterium]|nr:DUF1365 family protein [bacterium]